MRWIAALLFRFLLLSSPVFCHAQTDGGGQDVRIALFSAFPVQRVTIAAAGPQAWWAACETCRHVPLITPIHMPDTREILAGGPVTVHDEGHVQSRTANGGWHFRVGQDGAIKVVLTLPSERYVEAVLMGETLPGEPRESLRAMAVVARTLALGWSDRKVIRAQTAKEICDSTACQAIKLGSVSDAVVEATRSTSGETLWFGAQRAQVFFSGSCGGTTESAGAVWPLLAGVPYLGSMPDPYCVRKDRASWHAEVPVPTLEQIAQSEGWRVPPHVIAAQVSQRTTSQRARLIAFSGADDSPSLVSASALRLAVGRALGWDLIRSDDYELHLRDGVLVFDGRGHGHGVGLCQQGAMEMALMGKSYREILSFYFPGTTVRILHADEGWQQTSQGGILFLGTAHFTSGVIPIAEQAWKSANTSFPPLRQVEPTVIFAPSTEVFRQFTSRPGWELASTSGATIVMQPQCVFVANNASLDATLRHEMLHVAVESSTSMKTSLWLREGLVEVLAGDATHEAPALSAEETERLLVSASNLKQSQAAHVAAGARARLLVERYGISAVRGWIISGSPAPVG